MSQATCQLHTPGRNPGGRRYSRRFIKLSLLSFVSYLGITACGAELISLAPWAAALTAMLLVTAMNFFLMRRYVFESHDMPWQAQCIRFILSIAAFRLIEYGVFVLGVSVLGLPYLPCYAVILIVSFGAKYLIFRDRVFRPSKPIVFHQATNLQ